MLRVEGSCEAEDVECLRVEGSCEAEDVECLRVDVVVRLRV